MDNLILREEQTPDGSTALVDLSLLLPIFKWTDTAKPLNAAGLMCLFQFSEAVVLCDELWIPTDWRGPGGGTLGKVDPMWARSLSSSCRLHPDLTSFSVDFGIPNDDVFDQAMGFCFRLEKRFGNDWARLGVVPQDLLPGVSVSIVISDALNLVHRAWKWQAQFVLNPFWEHFFSIDAAPPSPAQTVYDTLSEGLRKEIDALKAAGVPIPIYVPPIPAVVLERCRGNPSRYWTELESLRQEFAATRAKYQAFQAWLKSPTEDLGTIIQKRREMIGEVRQAIDRVTTGRADGRLLFEMWDAVGSIKDGGHNMELSIGGSANVKNILGAVVKWFKIRRVKRRARSLLRPL